MDATFLNELANYAAAQPATGTIVRGALIGAAIAVTCGILFALANHGAFIVEIVTFTLLGAIALAGGGALAADTSAANNTHVSTPTATATAALTKYLTAAHDLTLTGPITLTTAHPAHTDIAHSPGRAEALAENAAGDLVTVTVTWNDPSMNPDDNLVAVITAPATT